jgi:isoleucyl-tRNA synthetase
MALGPRALAGAAEALRKVRNSARFMLGNIGSGPVAPLVRAEMSLVRLCGGRRA